MTNVYWTRLNETPLLTLPESAGAEARKRFEETRFDLFVARNKSKPPFDSNDEACTQSVQINKAGQFHYWSKVCSLPDAEENPYIRFARTPFDFSRNGLVSYPSRCFRPEEVDQKKDTWMFELLPAQAVGLFFVDWDRDGDEDVAILLASGSYIFFRREACPPYFS